MKKLIVLALSPLLASAVLAKLPAPSEEAQAKAAEAKAKTAWTDKVAAYQLCKSQDKVAAGYLAKNKTAAKPAAGLTPCADPGPFAYKPDAPANAAPAATPAPAPAAKKV
jgi:hypothetical protein